MIQQRRQTQMLVLGAAFLGFSGVVGLGSLMMMRHGGEASGAGGAFAPVDAGAALSAPAPVVGGGLSGAAAGSAAAGSSPAPLLSDDVRADAAAQAAASAPPAGAAAAPRLVPTRGLDTTSSATSSAQASVSSAQAKTKAAAGKKPFFAPKLDLSKNQGSIASTVHYGVSSRSELMGRAAGPVYNFAGKSVGQGQSAQVAAGSMDAAGAIQQVNAAQKQVDSTDASNADKAQVDQGLNQVRQTVQGGQ